MRVLDIVIHAASSFFLAYITVFLALNLYFVALSFLRIRRQLRAEHLRPAAASEGNTLLPTVTLLVPAFNEEVTIVESIRSLLRLRYPSFEIVVCNDGSTDRTAELLRREFHLVRVDLAVHRQLETAPVLAVYECRQALPNGLTRLLLIDKEQAGKADALNTAINYAHGEFVVSIDADSVLSSDALLRAVRPIADAPDRVVAVGAQVGLVNGSRIEDGQIVEPELPHSWLGMFQAIEYMRSFAEARVALAALNSLVILSGVFALLKRDLVIAVGGFLSPRMRGRVGVEYCGPAAHTVCEDMEIIVRLHRYLLDKRVPGEIVILPFTSAWTEAPDNWRDLGRQRARWYRGLVEVLFRYHRAMLFRPRFRQVGLFALPYQLVFEASAPLVEVAGYLIVLAIVPLGLVPPGMALAFLGYAVAVNLCLSTLSVLLCVYSERATRVQTDALSLFPYARFGDVVRLIAAGALSLIGYHQFLVISQLRGLRDFLGGRRGWEKFPRRGFLVRAAT